MAVTPEQALQNIDARVTVSDALASSANAAAAANMAGAIGQAASVQVDPYPVSGGLRILPNNIADPADPTDMANDVRLAFDYALGVLPGSVQPMIANFLQQFFPDILAAVKNNSDQWIADTILNGSYMPAAVESAIWNKARDNELQGAVQEQEEIADMFGSRGFTAPPGVMFSAMVAAKQAHSRKLLSVNREIAIKRFDTANENTKFAIQQAVSLRSSFVSAMGDFIKVVSTQQNHAVDYAKTIAAARASFYDASFKLYSGRIDEEKLRTGVLLQDETLGVQQAQISAAATTAANATNVERAKLSTEAMMKSAEILAKIAQATLAAQSNIVSVMV